MFPEVVKHVGLAELTFLFGFFGFLVAVTCEVVMVVCTGSLPVDTVSGFISCVNGSRAVVGNTISASVSFKALISSDSGSEDDVGISSSNVEGCKFIKSIDESRLWDGPTGSTANL